MAKDGKGKKSAPITTDERFSGIHNDPRFNLPRRNDFKVEVDERFSKSDLESIKRKAKIDKYGRKIKDDDNAKAFNKYYKTKEDEKKKKKKEEESSDEESSEEEKSDKENESDEESSEQESGVEVEADEAQAKLDLARGEGLPSDYESSSDESSSDEESSEDEDEEDEDEENDEKPPEGEPSKRFAVVNLDWDHVKSVDLFATFQSFVPASGHIDNIAIYPSQFGKERMQREDMEGPPKELFKSKKKSKKSKNSDDESESDSDSELEAKDLYEEGDAEVDYDSKSLRRYQLQRLRYYYAVVTCDSIKTAKNIYDNCDGTEYESTANFFDLRYIPDEMEFNDDEPRDSCNKIPSNYKPETFVTDALQHSKVKLTWDETPAERVKLSSKAFSQRELDDMDFKAYLASDNSDEESDHEDLKNKYKNLVGASTKIGNKNIFDQNNDNDNDDVDMEITFTPGLDEGSEKVEAPKAGDDEESTLDKLKRKAKERRQARKEKIKELKKEAEEKKKDKPIDKNNKKRDQKDLDDKSKAELELLMLDENNEKHAEHFNLKELMKSEKEKAKKSKHRNKDKIIEDDFKADLNDPRFSEIFTNHDFAIDPSQPQFKKTATMAKILDERNKRREGQEGKSSNESSKKRKHADDAAVGSEDVNSLVQRIKRKSKK